ncbi:MAG: anti-sigma factor, partial [Halioglobus sp.]
KEEVQNRIARDYVVGTLCAQARRRCETLRKQLPELDQKIYAWSEKLQPMAEVVPAVEPSAVLWESIQTKIEAQQTETTPLWSRLGFLRALTAAFSFAAIGLAVLLATQPATHQLDYIAVLADGAGEKSFVATAVEDSKQLTIKRFSEAPPSGTQYQLWALSKTDGEARSLGLIANADESVQALTESDWRLIIDAHELLITVEPLGGSPIGEPGDQIVSRGLCVRLSTS